MIRRPARGPLVVLVTLASLTLPGCHSSHQARPRPVPETTTTTAVDLAAVAIRPVGGSTTTTLPATPGEAQITGRVVDERNNPVENATVRAEWFVFGVMSRVEATSGPDGAYQLTGLHGGRWRVRAFRPPDGATEENPEFFLGSTEHKDGLTLKVRSVTGPAVTASIAPSPPVIRQDEELAVLVTQQGVDSEGRVVREPLSNVDVQLTGSGRWVLVSGQGTRTTDDTGIARFRVKCQEAGAQPLVAMVLGQQYPLDIPACVEPAPETSTSGPAPTSTTRGSTTTTRLFGGGGTTTTSR